MPAAMLTTMTAAPNVIAAPDSSRQPAMMKKPAGSMNAPTMVRAVPRRRLDARVLVISPRVATRLPDRGSPSDFSTPPVIKAAALQALTPRLG